jgi:hypothetical protein
MEEGGKGGGFKSLLGNKVLPKVILHLSILLCSLPLLSAKSKLHEYHVSVTQMQYNASQKIFEVSVRVFTDDLEKGISKDNDSRRFVIKDNDQNNPLVEKYIRKNFILSSPQKKAEINYLGKEQEADATWIYLEIPFQGTLENWRLQNSILMESFEDQVNMFNLKYASETKTLLYKKGKSVQTF